MQNSRFRNAKSKLLFFKEIIFTKSRLLLSLLIEVLENSKKNWFRQTNPYTKEKATLQMEKHHNPHSNDKAADWTKNRTPSTAMPLREPF